MTRSSNNNSKPIRPLAETDSTVLQHHAESECRPFFVDLSSLLMSQLDHLKQVGLIAAADNVDGNTSGDDDNDDNDGDGGLRQQGGHTSSSSLPEIQLLRSKHRSYVEQVWKRPLKAPFVSLDSSRPWMLYWCLHAHDLLQHQEEVEEVEDDDDDEDQDQQQLDTSTAVDGGKNTAAAAAAAATPTPTPSANEAPLRLQLQITNAEGNNMVETLRACFQSYYYYGTKKSPPLQSSTSTTSSSGGSSDGGGNQSSLYYETHPMDGCGGDGENEEDDDNEERRPSSSPRQHSYYCGGFGGGPGQMAHAATTYAAVLVLCILATDHENTSEDEDGSEEAAEAAEATASTATATHYSVRAMELLESVRIPLYRWIVSLQEPLTAERHAGGFRMHHDGEVDVRATYCVMTVSALLGFIPSSSPSSSPTSSSTPPTTSTETDQSITINHRSAIDYVVRCQTYEGGLGGEPWTEAHGGYTFCGVAALQLMGYFHHNATTTSSSSSSSSQRLDIQSLIGWLSRRQQSFEGGFSGRSNKLVDGCYSFWQGGAIAITSAAVAQISGGDTTPLDPWLDSYRQQGSERCMKDSLDVPYPLLFDVAMLERYILLCAQEVEGGLRDKPSKPRDFYHSCYNLSGLSVAQKCSNCNEGYGHPKQTSLTTTHPVYNIRVERVDVMLKKTWCRS